jgi:anti-sigma factor RsiW
MSRVGSRRPWRGDSPEGQRRITVWMVNRRIVVFSSLFAGLVLAASAAASCVPMTPAQQRARADIIFDGVALDGPTPTGIYSLCYQLSDRQNSRRP